MRCSDLCKHRQSVWSEILLYQARQDCSEVSLARLTLCQGEGRQFESGRPLQKTPSDRGFSLFQEREQSTH